MSKRESTLNDGKSISDSYGGEGGDDGRSLSDQSEDEEESYAQIKKHQKDGGIKYDDDK